MGDIGPARTRFEVLPEPEPAVGRDGALREDVSARAAGATVPPPPEPVRVPRAVG